MKIIITGSRHWNAPRKVHYALDIFNDLFPITELVHGGARGADEQAAGWALVESVQATSYLADWNKHGRKAGPIRNSLMIKENLDAGAVIAFPIEGSKGTMHTITLARNAGKYVWTPWGLDGQKDAIEDIDLRLVDIDGN